MREALARSDFDAVRRSPAPARARRATGAGARANGGARRGAASGAGAAAIRLLTAGLALISGLLLAIGLLAWRALERWPVSVVGGLLATALSAAIIVNAVSLQEGPHPSPLFGDPVPAATRREPLPPRRTDAAATKSAATSPAPTNAAPAVTPPRKAPAQPPAAAAQAAANDPIAHLLTTGAPPPAAKSAGSAMPNSVLAVQKALVKLGYAITADGLNGPATRQAISAFEKLEGLPVTGDPANAAMRKALSVATGMTLD